MYKYVLKRMLMMIPVLIGVTFVVFFIMDLTPSDPARIILGDLAPQEQLDALREEMGLNDNVFVRYFRYLSGLIQGDWGRSFRNNLPVFPQVMERVPNTMLLATSSMLFALAVGVPIGILSARKQYTAADNISTVLAMAGASMPSFWLGLLLVFFFTLVPAQPLFPPFGMGQGFGPLMHSLVLPTITLGTVSTAIILRMTRSSMLEVMRQEYIDTVRAKGLHESKVVTHHMLKNALVPIITVIGLQFGMLLGGAAMVETVFAWPGLGGFMVDNIRTQDIPMVMGSVVFLAIMYSIVNLVVDLLYAFVDPRIRLQYKS